MRKILKNRSEEVVFSFYIRHLEGKSDMLTPPDPHEYFFNNVFFFTCKNVSIFFMMYRLICLRWLFINYKIVLFYYYYELHFTGSLALFTSSSIGWAFLS